MTDDPTHLSADEIEVLTFAARRQLTRWANKPELHPSQRGQRAALQRALRILGDQAFTNGCELRVASEE